MQKPPSLAIGYDASRSMLRLREGAFTAERRAAAPLSQRALDYDYRVRELTSGELEIEALWSLGERRADVQGICYEVRFGRSRPTKREQTALKHLMQGVPPDEIAAAPNIGMQTMKFHQANLLSKLGADSRADLLRLSF